MPQAISHKGKVVAVSNDIVKVEIVSASACASCHAAGLCSASQASIKIIDVPASCAVGVSVGDEVQVSLGSSLAGKAVILAYVVPVVLLLATVLLLAYLLGNELQAAAGGLLSVVLWFAVLSLFRGRLERQYGFYITK